MVEMSKQLAIFNKVHSLYIEKVKNYNGLIYPVDVKKIQVDSNEAVYLYHGTIDSFFVSAKDQLKKYFPNAEISIGQDYSIEVSK